jgi:hypothetical protein
MRPVDPSLPPAARRELAALDRAAWIDFHVRWAIVYVLGLAAGYVLGSIVGDLVLGLVELPDHEFGPFGLGSLLLGGGLSGAASVLGLVGLLHAAATMARAIRRWAPGGPHLLQGGVGSSAGPGPDSGRP